MTPLIAEAAAKELERAISALVPDGKRGASVVVVDAQGVGIGMAMKHGRHFIADFTLQQRWAKEAPTAQFRVKAVW